MVDLYAVEANITTETNPYVYLYKSQRVNVSDPYQELAEQRLQFLTIRSRQMKSL